MLEFSIGIYHLRYAKMPIMIYMDCLWQVGRRDDLFYIFSSSRSLSATMKHGLSWQTTSLYIWLVGKVKIDKIANTSKL